MTQLQKDFLELKPLVLNKFLQGLNPMQKKAVECVDGPLLILAGAGSGKTTVIINRIGFLLAFGTGVQADSLPENLTEADIDCLRAYVNGDGSALEAGKVFGGVRPKPWNILAITFTNKAASELCARLSNKLGEYGEEVVASTFHSFCRRVLNSHIEKLGYSSRFTIYDADDSLRLIKECLQDLGFVDDKFYNPKTIAGVISRAKDRLEGPEDLHLRCVSEDRPLYFAKVYELYQSKLKSANAVDFDDLIFLTVKLFKEFPEVLQQYQTRFEYIMVDEYQDTNPSQYVLIRLLSDAHKNICVVGDDDQSIYRFRGATVENILGFEENFKNTTVIKLEQNYRCTEHILSAANSVIANNLRRKEKTLWTKNETGGKIVQHLAGDDRQEARYIAKKIEENVENGAKYSDHAILYRMNGQSNVIEQVFVQLGIPHRIVGGKRFFERKEIKDVLAYLQLVNNPSDTLRLRRIINEPKRGLGDVTIAAVEEIAVMTGQTAFEVMLNAENYPPLAKKAAVLKLFSELIQTIAENEEKLGVVGVFDEVLNRSGYLRALQQKNDFESMGRIDNINELRSTVQKYVEENEEPTLLGFLEDIALYTELDSIEPEDDAVLLMTLHSAKGLEFPTVFMVGMEENIFPSPRSASQNEDLEEERRLAYVGITRAKRQLYFTRAYTRMLAGRTTYNQPSRFLSHIPQDILKTENEELQQRGVNRVGYTEHRHRTVAPPMAQVSKKDRSFAFSEGERVRHKAFGEGKIVSIVPMGGDYMVEIDFDSGATKKLMASYIRLESV